MKKNLFFLLTMLIATGCATNSKKEISVEEKKADAYYTLGTQNLVDKEYTKALSNLLEAKKYAPKNSFIRNNLGMAYYFKDQHDLAIVELKKSYDLDNKNTDALLNIGSIYLNQKKFDEAINYFKRVEKNLVYLKQDRTYFNMGQALLGKGDRKGAISYFNKSIQENNDYCAAHFKLGEIYKEEYRFNEALTSFKNASLGTCVSEPSPHYEQALALISLNRYPEARRKLIEIKEKFASTRYETLATVQLDKLHNINDDSTRRTNYMSPSKVKESDIVSPRF